MRRPLRSHRSGRRPRPLAVLVALVALSFVGCSDGANPLAPFEGGRPLDLLRVTQSFTPEMQWVGGRVAAVGVNRGSKAALDTSLVWLQTAPGNDIGSFVTVGQNTAADLVRSFGGTPVDSLADGETYTFWIAEQSAFDLALDSTRIDTTAFADTTLAMRLVLNGRSGSSSDLDLDFEIARDERLTGNRFEVRWTPEDVRFCRLAIRDGSFGAFTELVWHVLIPEEEPCDIAPPVTVGVPPEGTQVVVPFPEDGFEPTNYTLWAVTEDWNESFNPAQAQGYATFLIFANNFED